MLDYEMIKETFKSKEVIFEGKIITVERWKVSLPDGKPAYREAVLHPGAAAVVPLDEYGNVTMVKQHRIVSNSITWEIPAGKLDSKDEKPLHAAQRELEEETGLTAKQWIELTSICTTPGFSNERITIFLAKGLEMHSAHPDPGEFVKIQSFPLTELVEKCKNGSITDSKTIIGLLLTSLLERENDRKN